MLLANIDVSKSTGPDGLSATMLKETARVTNPAITMLLTSLCLTVCSQTSGR